MINYLILLLCLACLSAAMALLGSIHPKQKPRPPELPYGGTLRLGYDRYHDMTFQMTDEKVEVKGRFALVLMQVNPIGEPIGYGPRRLEVQMVFTTSEQTSLEFLDVR